MKKIIYLLKQNWGKELKVRRGMWKRTSIEGKKWKWDGKKGRIGDWKIEIEGKWDWKGHENKITKNILIII